MKHINFCYGCDVFGDRQFSGDDYEDSIMIPKKKTSCPYCYVRYKVFPAMGFTDESFYSPAIHVGVAKKLMSTKTPEIFVGSIMGDFLSPSIRDEEIYELIETISEFSQHIVLLLSKNSARYYNFLKNIWKKEFPENIIIGTSVENETYSVRISHLRRCLDISPKTRIWVEIEPLLGFHNKTDFSFVEYVSCSCLGTDQIYYQSGKRFPWIFREEWMMSIIENETLDKNNLSIHHNIRNLSSSDVIRDWENPNLYERYFHIKKRELSLW